MTKIYHRVETLSCMSEPIKRVLFGKLANHKVFLRYRKTDLVMFLEEWPGNGLPVLGVGVVCTLVILIMHLETGAKRYRNSSAE